jgi:hypothetical protein
MKLTVIFLALLLASCSNQTAPIQKGMSYLNSVYDNGDYDDQYLKYVYPDENLLCDVDGCDLTYRKLDAYFNLMFIKESTDVSLIQDQVMYADNVLESIEPNWESGKIYNTLKSDGQGYALDTYCIFGFIKENKNFADNVVGYLSENDWLASNHFTSDRWRNIADETWCIRLLQKTGYSELALNLSKIKVSEVNQFLGDSDFDDVAVLVHMLHLANDLELSEKPDYQLRLVNLSKNEEVRRSTHLLSNILESLAKSGYENKSELDSLALLITSRQNRDGSWTEIGFENDNFQVFTTFRAIVALSEYQKIK